MAQRPAHRLCPKPGSVEVLLEGGPRCPEYHVEMQEKGSATWTRILTTGRVKHELTGLITGKEYSFRVQVVTASGVSPMSEAVSQKAA